MRLLSPFDVVIWMTDGWPLYESRLKGKMAENKPDLPDSKTEQAVREIAGQERDRAAITEREAALPESVLREPQREREAVREIARENLLQERLQQMERDMVRDLQKEKTLGGD